MERKDEINLLCNMAENYVFNGGSDYFLDVLANEWKISIPLVFKIVNLYKEEKDREWNDCPCTALSWTDLALKYKLKKVE